MERDKITKKKKIDNNRKDHVCLGPSTSKPRACLFKKTFASRVDVARSYFLLLNRQQVTCSGK